MTRAWSHWSKQRDEAVLRRPLVESRVHLLVAILVFLGQQCVYFHCLLTTNWVCSQSVKPFLYFRSSLLPMMLEWKNAWEYNCQTGGGISEWWNPRDGIWTDTPKLLSANRVYVHSLPRALINLDVINTSLTHSWIWISLMTTQLPFPFSTMIISIRLLTTTHKTLGCKSH